ncbi:PREDICTED: protein LITTLE ZIPPER 1-like [Nelumbo nucifera]|uniref:Protein LITTLE ZIPPER 1-like n=1 Tax=Nelumbo nucifera TaxID=4432 RepID=A0A1U8BC79_NELNU|nr:PREDICTED: protein LITTLE ZIPPER 1-like [Nelumbo nucifera]
MCINASEWYLSSPSCSPARRYRPKKSKVRVRRLSRRNRRLKKEVVVVGTEMELKNLRLYLENRSIIEENEKLRQKALLLHQENRALMCELQKKFSHLDNLATHLHHNYKLQHQL